MKNEIATKMSPEGLTIANTYLEVGNVPAVCARLKMDTAKVSEMLNKREIKAYIDQVYLDTGYRNRFKLANSLDDLIERKLEEAEESQIYTNKDLADLYVMAHKMRVDEMARASNPVVLEQLAAMTADWPASDRPRRWVLCPELAPTDAGKWQRQAWRDWLERLDLAQG